MLDLFRFYAGKGIGPGGYKCNCCGPSPSKRKLHRRLTRKRLNANLAVMVKRFKETGEQE